MTVNRCAEGERACGRTVIPCRWLTAILLMCLCLGALPARATVDLVVNGTDSPDPVVTLSNLTYTITVTNAGTTIATNVAITNILSSQVTFSSVTTTRGSCSNVSGVVYCDWANVTNGTGGRVTVVVKPNRPGSITNVVSAGALRPDTNPTDNVSTQVTTVVNRRVFGSTDFIQVQDITPNTAVPYPSTINVSGLTAAVYKVTVTLTNLSHTGPDDLDIMLVGPSGGYIMLYSDGPPVPEVIDATITFDDAAAQPIPDSGAITSGTFRPANYGNIADVMPSPAPAGPHFSGFPELSVFNRSNPNGQWRLFVYDDESEAGGWIDGWGLTLLTMETMANLAVSTIDSPDPALPGQTITYFSTVTNMGPAGATDVRLTNRVPAGVEIVSYSATRGTCVNVAGVISCDIGPMPVGGSETLTVQVRLLNGGSYTNQTEVSSAELDTQPLNNISLQTTTVDPRVDLGIDVSASRAPALLEQPLVYVLAVTNLGPDAAAGVRVVDQLPPGVVLVNAIASQGSCSNQSGIVTCNLGSVASRGRASVTLTCRPTVLGPITNVVSITGDQVDTNAANNTAQNVNAVDPAADVQLSLSDSPDPVLISQAITYSIVVTNRGPNVASNLVVSDVLPASLRFVSAQSSHGTCSNEGNSVGCTIPEVAPGDRPVITIVATALTVGTVGNGASVTLQPVDPNPGNNIASVSTLVLPTADVSISKASEQPQLWQGDRVTYNLLVSNAGPSTATAARMQDMLPQGVSFVSATSTVGSCVFQNGTVTCTFGDLPTGGWARISVVGTAGSPGLITNTANAFANEQDLNLGNNAALAVTEVLPKSITTADTNTIVLPDVGTAPIYPLTLNVTGMTATVQRVRVTLQGLSHSYPDDLDVLLVGPRGQGVVLMSDAGGGTTISNVDLTLDDLAATVLPDNTALTGSHYQPADYEPATNEFPPPAPAGPYSSSFNVFTGTDPNGTWKLYLVDDAVKDQAILRGGWRLDIWARDPMADLELGAIATPQLVAVGNDVTIAVTLSNHGPGTATSVVLTNAYGPNLSFSGAAASQGNCTNDGGIVRCSLGDIAPGASAFVQMSLTVLAAGGMSNSVGVVGSSIDFNGSNNLGTVSFVAENPARILMQPRDQRVFTGGTAVFEVTASGEPPLSFQWYHDGTAIPGETTATLTIHDVQPAQWGEYRVEVSNRVATVLSSIAVLGAPRPPVMDAIADQLGEEDTLLVVPLTVSDPDNPFETFQLSAMCDDTNLVPTTNMTFAVSGTNYTLLIQPGTNQFGTNIITVTATDSMGLSATRTFVLGVESVNDYPEFVLPVLDFVMEEDTVKAIRYEVADAETPDAALVVAMRTYSPSVMPVEALNWFGTGSNRYIMLSPSGNRNGTALLELRVRDQAGVRTTNLFHVTVLPVEDPPTISTIDDVTISEDSELNVSFVVSDPETPSDALLVRAESSNPGLFNNTNFNFEVSGTNRTLRALPLPDQYGTSQITVFVEDQAGMVASNVFSVTVTPVNDAPVVSVIPEVITAMDTTSAEVAFTVGDLESDATNLTLSAISTNTVLAPLSGIAFGGLGSNRTVRVTPGTGEVGWMVLRVEIADPDGGVTTRDFELTVSPTNGAPLIVWQPEDQALTAGSPLRLRVIAKGPGKLRYQWQRDSLELTDQTNSVLAIAAAVGADRGEYRVRITNDEGTVLSDPARVTVLEGTRILSIKRIAETVELTFPTVSVQRYIVEYRDSLDIPWTAFPEVTGTGGILTFTDPAAPGATRFYRVRVE